MLDTFDCQMLVGMAVLVIMLCFYTVMSHVLVTDNNQHNCSPVCVKRYYDTFTSRPPPPRDYLFYHETLMPENHRLNGVEESPFNFQWRIVGGHLVSIQEVPYQVLYGKFCGGTLIAPNWVLTAAHCKEKETYIYAGSTSRNASKPYKICAHFVHPLWNATRKLHSHDYDYQLVLLEEPVPVTPFSRPIAIGDMEYIQPGREVSISGWGHLAFRANKMQDHLRRVFVPVIPAEICKTMPDGDYDKITPRMFCAGNARSTVDACQGDSGGPAVVNGKIVGLVSFGVGCASPHHPGVYTAVPLARDWIRAVTCLPL